AARSRQAGAGAGAGAGAASGSGSAEAGARRGGGGMLWYLDEHGKLAMTRVRAGLSDGQKTAVEGRDVKAGMQVIVGTAQQTTTAATPAVSSPLQPGGGQRRFGGPGGF